MFIIDDENFAWEAYLEQCDSLTNLQVLKLSHIPIIQVIAHIKILYSSIVP